MALPAQTSVLRRVIVGVALLGVVVVTHLALQKAAGFANGCTGLGDDVSFAAGAATTGTTAGCAAVTESEYASFLGVSNIALGIVFYGVVALLRLGYAVLRDDRLRLASGVVTTAGLLYTGYLVYLQAAVIGSFCPLCMASAALVAALFALHAVEHRRVRRATGERRRRAAAPDPTGFAALRPYATVLGSFVVLLLATFGLASRAERAQAAPGNGLSVNGAPTAPAPRIQDVTGACEYDPSIEPVADLSAFTDGPFKGSPSAPVTVVKVFDPNCPFCRELSDTMGPVVEERGAEARFFYVAYPLRQQSLGQVVALRQAAGEGKFFELLEEMFARQDQQWGMSMPELVATLDAVDMDGEAFEALLNDQARLQPILAEIQADAEAVQAAFSRPDGGISVPKLAVNGRVVAPTHASYSARCLDEFIAGAE